MEIKKYFVNTKQISLNIVDQKLDNFEIQINSSGQQPKKGSVSLIYFNPKTDTCVFEINGIIHRAKLLEYKQRNKTAFTVYLFDSAKIFEISEYSDFLIQPAKRDLSDTFLLQKPNSLGEIELKSPLSGKVIRVLAQNNQKITTGSPIVTIESMKMENEICANCDGFVKNVFISEGDLVKPNQLLISFKKEK